MRDFFDRQGRTRVLGRGVLIVHRGLKLAENAAYRKKIHFGKEILLVGIFYRPRLPNDRNLYLPGKCERLFNFFNDITAEQYGFFI